MYCNNCGKEIRNDVSFCEGCGMSTTATQSTIQEVPLQNGQQAYGQPTQGQQPYGQPTQGQQPYGQSTQGQQYNQAPGIDQDNKLVFILSYLGILFFLPLVSCPESKTGRFHANQGLILLLTSVLGNVILGIVATIMAIISVKLIAFSSLLFSIWGLAMLTLVIIGMVNASKDEKKPLPIIGVITIIK